mgnify:FL=1
MTKRLFIVITTIIALLLSANTLRGEEQGRFYISGKIVEDGGREPLFMATVVVKELGLWSVTDERGEFKITNIPAGKYTVEFSNLGYETREMVLDIKKDLKGLNVLMKTPFIISPLLA